MYIQKTNSKKCSETLNQRSKSVQKLKRERSTKFQKKDNKKNWISKLKILFTLEVQTEIQPVMIRIVWQSFSVKCVC